MYLFIFLILIFWQISLIWSSWYQYSTNVWEIYQVIIDWLKMDWVKIDLVKMSECYLSWNDQNPSQCHPEYVKTYLSNSNLHSSLVDALLPLPRPRFRPDQNKISWNPEKKIISWFLGKYQKETCLWDYLISLMIIDVLHATGIDWFLYSRKLKENGAMMVVFV